MNKEQANKQSIILKMYELSEEDLVQLNNLIIGDSDWGSGGIYKNDKHFFDNHFPSHFKNVKHKHETLHSTWIRFDGRNQLESFAKMTVSKLTQTVGDIPTYIENNFDQFKDLLKL